MSWIEKLNFEEAIREICEDERQGKDFCLDPLRFEDFSIKSVKELLINSCKEKIRRGYVDPLIEIDVPKSNYILRPGARPNILDWVVYQAIVNFIGKNIYRLIPYCSYSFNGFRERFKKGRKRRKIDHWLDFENKTLEYSKKYRYMLVTDITSFFENISLSVLKERLLTIYNDPDYSSAVNYLIENMLKPWTTNNRVTDFGLPQGPTASSILADIYLYSVDREIKKQGIIYFRYMDDIRIFAKNKNEIKRALKYLVKALRDLKLNLNAKKTDIYDTTNNESLNKVFDSEKNRLNFISEAFKSRKFNQIISEIPSLFKLFSKIDDPKNAFVDRHIRFLISHLIELMKFRLLDKEKIKKFCIYFINLLENKPHLTNIICWFFLAACSYDNSLKELIKNKLIKFLNSPQNIYEWQEMWILDTLRQFNNLTMKDLRLLKNKVKAHELCQGQLALILGQSGNPDYREDLLDKVRKGKVKNDQIRNFALAVQEMHKDIKQQILRQIPEYFRKYLEKLSKPKYGFIYSLPEIELEIEYLSEYL